MIIDMLIRVVIQLVLLIATYYQTLSTCTEPTVKNVLCLIVCVIFLSFNTNDFYKAIRSNIVK
jgi:hypothetical protein